MPSFMADSPPRLVRAWFDSLSSGILEFDRDWTAAAPPSLILGPDAPAVAVVDPAPESVVGGLYGFLRRASGEFAFVLPLLREREIDPVRDAVYLAGDFNGWQEAIGRQEWKLVPAELDGARVLLWTGPVDRFLVSPAPRFKFVTGEHCWLTPPNDAPNTVRDEHGNLNRVVDLSRTGRHLWRFTLEAPIELTGAWTVTVSGAPGGAVPLGLGRFFFELSTQLELGAVAGKGATVFRLFAPRARSVTLHLCRKLADESDALTYALSRRPDQDD